VPSSPTRLAVVGFRVFGLCSGTHVRPVVLSAGRFPDWPIDNTTAPFVPKIFFKPNAKVPPTLL